ncbi:methyltransferase domain-containing protein [soil metagenome]
MEPNVGTRWQLIGGNAAETYHRLLVPGMFAPLAPRLVDLSGIEPGDHVLDVACGTGVVSRVAAERVGSSGRVVGLDFSPAMIAVARELPQSVGVAIEWLEANALAMPLPDNSFDVVLCQHGLQQIPDRVAALREIRRVLKPGGQFAACVWSRIESNPGMNALVDALGRNVSPEAANYRRAPFALSDPDHLHSLVVEAGFVDVQIQTLTEIAGFVTSDELVDGQLRATPLSTTTAGVISDDVRDAIANDVRAALERYHDGEKLKLPIQAHFVHARAGI